MTAPDAPPTSWWTRMNARPWDGRWGRPGWPEALAGRLRGLAERLRPGPPAETRIALPLIVGVTGHRDLPPEDEPALRAALARVFADLRAFCPATPLVLMSALAEGADRLAAEVFLEDPAARLLVPLPLELEAYRRTFERDLPEFDALLARAEKTFLVPYPDFTDSGLAVVDYRQAPHCYAALGAYLAEHCHLLLALWDKAPLAKIGGTSEVVRMRLAGRCEPHPTLANKLSPSPGHPVIHIWTRRQKPPETPPPTIGMETIEPSPRPRKPVQDDVTSASGLCGARPPGSIEVLTPGKSEDSQRLTRLTLIRLEEFNRGLSALKISRHPQWLWPVEHEAELTEGEKLIRSFQAGAEALAGIWGARLRRRLMWLFLGGWLALLGSQLYRLWPVLFPGRDGWPSLLLCGLTGLLVIGGYLQVLLGDWQNRHLSYRGLAEAWRVQFYWRLLGVNRSVARDGFSGEKVEDYGETRWLRLALAYTGLADGGRATGEVGRRFSLYPDDQMSANRSSAVHGPIWGAEVGRSSTRRRAADLWLDGQWNFFRKKKVAARKKRDLCLWPAMITLSLGSVWSILGRFLGKAGGSGGQILVTVFLVAIILATVVSAYYQLSSQMAEYKKWLALALAGAVFSSAALVAPRMPLSPELSLLLLGGGLLSLGTGGLLLAYLKLSAFAENARRYGESERLFQKARELLAEGHWPERDLAALVGRKALAENSAWLRQHLERPISLPLS